MNQSTLCEKYEKWSKKNTISEKYQFRIIDLHTLASLYKTKFDFANHCFNIGYMQGVKATQAEMKKKAVAK